MIGAVIMIGYRLHPYTVKIKSGNVEFLYCHRIAALLLLHCHGIDIVVSWYCLVFATYFLH